MKTKWIFFQVIILSIIFLSCQKGKQSDPIHLSGKEFNFHAIGDSVLVTTKGTSWWLTTVLLDSAYLDIPSNAGTCDFEYADSDIQIVRRSCNSLFIKMNGNPKSLPRTLFIGLERDDYFDGVKITQSKK